MPTRVDNSSGVGGAAKQVAEHASSLAKLELELAGLELKRKVGALGAGLGLGLGAALFALFAFGFLLATAAAAPRATHSTRSRRHARRSHDRGTQHHAQPVIGKRYACSSILARVRSSPEPLRSTNCARSSSPHQSRYGPACAGSLSPSSSIAAPTCDLASETQPHAPAHSLSAQPHGASKPSRRKRDFCVARSPSSSTRSHPPCSPSPASARSAPPGS